MFHLFPARARLWQFLTVHVSISVLSSVTTSILTEWKSEVILCTISSRSQCDTFVQNGIYNIKIPCCSVLYLSMLAFLQGISWLWSFMHKTYIDTHGWPVFLKNVTYKCVHAYVVFVTFTEKSGKTAIETWMSWNHLWKLSSCLCIFKLFERFTDM